MVVLRLCVTKASTFCWWVWGWWWKVNNFQTCFRFYLLVQLSLLCTHPLFSSQPRCVESLPVLWFQDSDFWALFFKCLACLPLSPIKSTTSGTQPRSRVWFFFLILCSKWSGLLLSAKLLVFLLSHTLVSTEVVRGENGSSLRQEGNRASL